MDSKNLNSVDKYPRAFLDGTISSYAYLGSSFRPVMTLLSMLGLRLYRLPWITVTLVSSISCVKISRVLAINMVLFRPFIASYVVVCEASQICTCDNCTDLYPACWIWSVHVLSKYRTRTWRLSTPPFNHVSACQCLDYRNFGQCLSIPAFLNTGQHVLKKLWFEFMVILFILKPCTV